MNNLLLVAAMFSLTAWATGPHQTILNPTSKTLQAETDEPAKFEANAVELENIFVCFKGLMTMQGERVDQFAIVDPSSLIMTDKNLHGKVLRLRPATAANPATFTFDTFEIRSSKITLDQATGTPNLVLRALGRNPSSFKKREQHNVQAADVGTLKSWLAKEIKDEHRRPQSCNKVID